MLPVTHMTDDQALYWSELNPQLVVFTAPEDPPGCVPCPAMVTEVVEGGRRFKVVRVPWQLDDDERALLTDPDATIWVSTWGGLPPHMLEVQPSGPVIRTSTEQPAEVPAVEPAPAPGPPETEDADLTDMDRVVTGTTLQPLLVPADHEGHYDPAILVTVDARRAGHPDMDPTRIRYIVGASEAIGLAAGLARTAQAALQDASGFGVEAMNAPEDPNG